MRTSAMLVGLAFVLVAGSWPSQAGAQAVLYGTYIDYLGVGANGIMINSSDQSMRYRETSTGTVCGDVWTPGSAIHEVTIEATGTTTFMARNEYTGTDIPTTSSTAVSGRSITWSGRYVAGSHAVSVDLVYDFEAADRHVLVTATVRNTGSVDLTDVYFLMHGDPDQAYLMGGAYTTYNDVVRQPPGDTSALITSAITSPGSYCIGVGTADSRARVSSAVLRQPDPSTTWSTPRDPGGALEDVGQSIVFRESSLVIGASVTYSFVYVWGTDSASVTTRFDSIDHDGDGYTLLMGDCDDTDDTVHPGITTDPCDGRDNDCDPSTPDGSSEPWYSTVCDGIDTDLCEDGFYECTGGTQVCNDDLAGIADLCDGTDNDCNPSTPDGSGDSRVDAPCDGPDTDLCLEGTGLCTSGVFSCTDASGDIPDLCNSVDDDCNPATPDGTDDPMVGTACDGDDPDLCEEGTYSCVGGSFSCSDTMEDALEICDGIDNDCDGTSVDGSEDPMVGVACDGADPDLCEEGVVECVDAALVCSDTMEDSTDVCDGIDNDCDPTTDDGTGEDWYMEPCDGADTDLCEEGVYGCVSGSQVCDDTSGDVEDLCNGADDDCNADTVDGQDEDWHDAPCDGPDTDLCAEGSYACLEGARTCTDATDNTTEECNGEDDDCNPHTDENVDDDGDGFSTCGGDCHDGDPTIHPDATEVCTNGLDDDCDGLIDDADGDCSEGDQTTGCSCSAVPGGGSGGALILLLIIIASTLYGRKRT